MKILDSLKIEDMPAGPLKFIAERAGMETAKELIQNYGGSSFYIPNEDNKKFLKKFIQENYSGNPREFAEEIRISTKTLYRHLRCSD